MSSSENSPTDSASSKNEVQSSLRPGRIMFGRYRLDRELGGGGMAVDWLAHDGRLNQPVTLKILPETLFRNAVARDGMKKETRHSLELTHPNIVRIYEFLEDDKAAAIAMEYVEGSTLSQLRGNRPQRCFEVDELRGWVAELCGALDYAHREAGLVHGDLKPSNLLITSRGSVKIADFGLSHQLHTPATQTALGETSEALCYMSPQQLAGDIASESDDIYALGATLYELLTGKPPFILGDIAWQIRTVTPVKMADRRAKLRMTGETIPEAWEDAIAACLAKHPSGRPSSAREVACFLGIDLERPNQSAAHLAFRTADVPPAGLAGGLLQEEAEPRTAPAWPEARSVAVRATGPPSTSPERRPWSLARKLFLLSVATAAALILALCVILAGRHRPDSAKTVAKTVPRANALPATPPGQSPMDNASAPAPLKPVPPSLKIVTTPAGIPFHILPTDPGKPSWQAVEIGESPAKVDGLQPGAYRLVLGGGRWPSRSLPFALEDAGNTTLVQDLPHGMVRIESQPIGAEIYEGGVLLGIAPVSIPIPPGCHLFVAEMEGNRTLSRTVNMAPDQTKDIQFEIKAVSNSRAGHEIAHHRHRPKRHAEQPMLARIGRSIRDAFIKAEAVILPHPGKDRRVWD